MYIEETKNKIKNFIENQELNMITIKEDKYSYQKIFISYSISSLFTILKL